MEYTLMVLICVEIDFVCTFNMCNMCLSAHLWMKKITVDVSCWFMQLYFCLINVFENFWMTRLSSDVDCDAAADDVVCLLFSITADGVVVHSVLTVHSAVDLCHVSAMSSKFACVMRVMPMLLLLRMSMLFN